MRLSKKNLINILVIVAVTIIAMYFSLKDNWSDIMGALGRLNILSVILIFGWGLGIVLVMGKVYQILGQHYLPNYTYEQGTVVAFVGNFFAGITPSSTGGQFGQIYVLKKQGIDYGDGASLLWADFIIYQTTMMIYVTILFILRFQHYVNISAWFWVVFAGYLVNVVVILALYTMALFPNLVIKLLSKLPKLLGRFHIFKDPEKQTETWIRQIKSFTKQIRVLANNKSIIFKCAGWNVVRLTLLFSLPFIVALFLGIELHFSQLIDTLALASFVTMANCFVPLPGATGGTEVFFTMLFTGMFHELTGAVLLLWRLASYYVPLIGGAIVFMMFKGRQEKQQELAAAGIHKTLDHPKRVRTDRTNGTRSSARNKHPEN